MDRQITIRRLLAIFMVAGLVLAPLSRPVMAESSPIGAMAVMSDDMAASAMTDEMANDMPCCPSKAPAPVDCDKCFFMATCMVKCFVGMSASITHPVFSVSGSIVLLANDAWPKSMGHPPPEHPPRTLV